MKKKQHNPSSLRAQRSNPCNLTQKRGRMDCFVTMFLAMTILLLAACESGNYKSPTISNSNAASMSDATLCYRYAGARKSLALNDEVAARRLDCGALLADDPLYR